MSPEDRIRRVIMNHLGVEEAPDTAGLAADLGADSLDMVEMRMDLEDEFGVDLPDEEIAMILTVGDAIRYVSGKL